MISNVILTLFFGITGSILFIFVCSVLFWYLLVDSPNHRKKRELIESQCKHDYIKFPIEFEGGYFYDKVKSYCLVCHKCKRRISGVNLR